VPTTGFERSRVIADKSRQRLGKLRIFFRCHDRGRRRDIPSGGRQRYAVNALRSAADPAASPQKLRAPGRLHVCAAIVSERNREKDVFWPRAGSTRRTRLGTCDR
jgi:hypothetical protein